MRGKPRKPTLTIRALRPLVAGLEAMGVAPRPLLRAADIPPDLLEDPDATVPGEAMAAFWAGALETTGDANLGMHLAEAAPIEAFEVHGYALLASRSLRDAYERACRYQRLIHESSDLVLEEDEGAATLRHTLPGGRPVGRQPAEFLVAAWLRFGHLVTGVEWMPEAVLFAHAEPDDARDHVRVFGDSIRFLSGQNALRVTTATLALPGVTGDPQLAGILDRHVASVIGDRNPPPTLAARVRAVLEERLHTGDLTASDVAKSLAMSERSLRRDLAAEGTSYRKILDLLRQTRALDMLSDRGCSVGEVAFLLGFSELSAFHRAFKRWTGTTPAEARRGPSGRSGQ